MQSLKAFGILRRDANQILSSRFGSFCCQRDFCGGFCVLWLVIKSRIPFDVSVIRGGVFMGLSAGPMGLVSAAGGLELVPPIIFDSSIGQTPFPCAVYGDC